MKKYYGVLILSALMAGAVFTGCGPNENIDSPVADNVVTEAATEEVTEAAEVTEAETEAATEPVTEETEPAVTEAASKREANLAAIDGLTEISFGEFGDYIVTHTISELSEMGCVNASDSVDGLAMAICNIGSTAGSSYYEPVYTTDFGKTWIGAEQSTDDFSVPHGTIDTIALDNGDLLMFIYSGPIEQPQIQIIRQSEAAPRPVISRNAFTFKEFEPEDGWDMSEDSFEASYDGGTVLHIKHMNKNTGELVNSFDVDFGDFDFIFEK